MTLYIVLEYRLDLYAGNNHTITHMYEVNNVPPVNLDMDDGVAVFNWLDRNYDPVLFFDGEDVDVAAVNERPERVVVVNAVTSVGG